MANIKQFLPTAKYDGKFKLDASRCAHKIYGFGRYFQCENGISETIEGYGFCKAHAVQVKAKLGQAEIIGYFYVLNRYGKDIKEIPYIKRTNSFYWNEQGDKNKISSHHLGKLFETYEEAIEYKHKSLKDAVISSKRRVEEVEKELAEFEANLLEASIDKEGEVK